ncbi:MAG: lipopolysaccharide 1,2-N-acetylglucosaminetransferase [Desulfobacterales bacterium]|nr:MAG: lipopolysaccharide 1,2-N-acetylglucosaminetransferase [Desulfobacterales bacterium]
MKIYSPMATGNGAFVAHSLLSRNLPGYHLQEYNPYLTIFPPLLSCLPSIVNAPDIIHSTPDYAWFFRRHKIPLVITFHNYVLDAFMKRYSSFLQRVHYLTDLKLFTRGALRNAHTITSVSHYTASLVKEDLHFDGDIKVIYNGIDTNLFLPGQKRSGGRIKVLFSGNLTRRKGAYLLASIAEKLDKNIVIQYTTGLRTKTGLPGLVNLENLGAIPYERMPEIYQQADILLFPTVREGFGLAAAEAMACGLPVVATNCSSLPELVVDGKGGYLCDLEDIGAFARYINALACSPQKRKEMGQFNRQKVIDDFSLARMVNGYKELFESIS